MPVSTECAATVLLSFRYPSIHIYFPIGLEGGVSFCQRKLREVFVFEIKKTKTPQLKLKTDLN